MIKANELRIGNYLQFYKPLLQEKQILQVTGIFKEDEIYFISSNEYSPINENGLIPIPLTPEILKGCSFKYDSDEIGDTLAESYVLDKFVWSVGLKEMYYNNEPLPHIEYLHQLQNLYLALTGKELNINLHVET